MSQQPSFGAVSVMEPETANAAAMGSSAEFLRVEGLRKTFRSGATEVAPFSNLSFSIESGELVAIVGPSGAGKSTLLHMLASLDTPSSGAIYFERNSLEAFAESELSEYRNRAVGFVWQRHHLLPDFSAAENVAMPLMIQGVRRESALRTAGEWLGRVGLGGRDNQAAGELSGGEQQRVAIARALVNSPKLLLADEPTGDLDERNAELIFDLIEHLHRSCRLTSVLATHNLSLAARAGRVLQFEHGKLVAAAEVPAARQNSGAQIAGTGANAPGEPR